MTDDEVENDHTTSIEDAATVLGVSVSTMAIWLEGAHFGLSQTPEPDRCWTRDVFSLAQMRQAAAETISLHLYRGSGAQNSAITRVINLLSGSIHSWRRLVASRAEGSVLCWVDYGEFMERQVEVPDQPGPQDVLPSWHLDVVQRLERLEERYAELKRENVELRSQQRDTSLRLKNERKRIDRVFTRLCVLDKHIGTLLSQRAAGPRPWWRFWS